MNEPIEYMCLECGISHHLDGSAGLEEERRPDGTCVLTHTVCSECGGALFRRGRPEDEPVYRTRPRRSS